MKERDVRIRLLTEEDTDNIIRWRNSPAVKEFFIYRAKLTAEDHMNWIETKIKMGKVVQFIIEECKTDCPVGSVYLRDIDALHQKAEFGIFIGEESVRGKGYGTQAAELILAYAFEELKLNKVFLRVFANNPRAIASYSKVGFVQEGVFRDDVWIDGKPYDMVYMGILKSEWKENQCD